MIHNYTKCPVLIYLSPTLNRLFPNSNPSSLYNIYIWLSRWYRGYHRTSENRQTVTVKEIPCFAPYFYNVSLIQERHSGVPMLSLLIETALCICILIRFMGYPKRTRLVSCKLSTCLLFHTHETTTLSSTLAGLLQRLLLRIRPFHSQLIPWLFGIVLITEKPVHSL